MHYMYVCLDRNLRCRARGGEIGVLVLNGWGGEGREEEEEGLNGNVMQTVGLETSQPNSGRPHDSARCSQQEPHYSAEEFFEAPLELVSKY